ncbi:hypothetical protein NQ317_006016 [Molorchus minor]|uniref:SWIM-type domain-containing protein n=1 Tax=Molorchus minor TaxID=1323400 RepID=A0ABQ9J2U9_9CUCU|nr:hypothetical protein NQ317_006016 [Molorchus minor]
MHSLQENIDFKSCQCRLVCSDCRVCIHRYVCSCIENSIKWNMCEHIHLVGRLRKDNEPPCEARTDVKKDYHELPVMLHENNSSNELFLEDTSSSLKEDLFIERKRNIKEKLLHIMKTVDNIETPIELYKFDKSLICFERSLEDVNLSH